MAYEVLKRDQRVSRLLGLADSQPEDYINGYLSPSRGMEGVRGGHRSIVFFGLGGSGIVGRVAAVISEEFSRSPVIAISDRHLPRWISGEDLIVLVSYSGETLEVIEAYREVMRRGVPSVVISSGGALIDHAERDNTPFIKLTSGLPPRMAFPLMLGASVRVLSGINVSGLYETLVGSIERLKDLRSSLSAVNDEGNISKEIAIHLFGGSPHVFASWPLTVSSYRFKTQLNENAKMPCITHEIPESMHNEVEALPFSPLDRYVLFRTNDEPVDVRVQLDYISSTFTDRVLEVRVNRGGVLDAIMISDYASIYLAALSGVDPINVPKISDVRKRIKERTVR